jgi:hypothetical protein
MRNHVRAIAVNGLVCWLASVEQALAETVPTLCPGNAGEMR